MAVAQQSSEDPSFALLVSCPVLPADPSFDKNPAGMDYDDNYAIDPIAVQGCA
jgi:hypothetical protein